MFASDTDCIAYEKQMETSDKIYQSLQHEFSFPGSTDRHDIAMILRFIAANDIDLTHFK